MYGTLQRSLLTIQVARQVSFSSLQDGFHGSSVSTVIYECAGRDATEAYSAIHSPATITSGLPFSALKGIVDTSTDTDEWAKSSAKPSQKAKEKNPAERPPLQSIINADDFELVAKDFSPAKTWAYYSSADTGLVTYHANRSLYGRIWLRPRVLRNVTDISTKTSVLGLPVSSPLMIAPTAMARLIHPDGELAIARAASAKGIIQCISVNASYNVKEIVDSIGEDSHPFLFQLYVDRQRQKSEAILAKLPKNIKAILVTVDGAANGKREADERVKADESASSPMVGTVARNDRKGGGLARTMSGYIDSGLCWDSVAWLRRSTNLNILVKGIMSADDVMLAVKYGLDGVVLSNHGGRNLDTAPPAILVLLECHRRFPEVFDKPNFEIHIDGGVRRGTDILKCLCLGAKGVYIGRNFLYAVAYGQKGVEHLVDIIQDELEVAMRNVGVTKIDELGPHLVNTGDLDHMVPGSALHSYARLRTGAKL